MRLQLRNLSSLNNFFLKERPIHFVVAFLFLFQTLSFPQQIANYVSNGGFEIVFSCTPPSTWATLSVKDWSSIDTTKSSFFTNHKCMQNIPGGSFQYPKSGNGYIRSTFLCDITICQNNSRAYFRNKLKSTLTLNTTYCVKFYVNILDLSPFGIDAFGANFTDNSIDSISYQFKPLTYLTPQVQNNSGNIITDTSDWVPITGTFIATGIEKYALIGNFKSDANTMTAQIQPTFSYMWCDVNLDHVSCIPIDLPAYAGPDTYVLAGDSVYIGRESDIEIDESCIWYKMTSPTTSISIDTIAGLYVKPASTTTYVVRQQLWCSGVKWDTVVVSLSGVGINELEALQNDISLFPNPASEFIQLQYTMDIESPFNRILFYTSLGQLIREENIAFKGKTVSVPISNLANGVYVLELKNSSGQSIKKRFVLQR